MKTYETQDGLVEVVAKKREGVYLVRFKDTGSVLIATEKKLRTGQVNDPFYSVKPKWRATYHSGDVVEARDLKELHELTGVSIPMLRKVNTGHKFSRVLLSVEKL